MPAAVAADKVADTLGVNVHMFYDDTPYAWKRTDAAHQQVAALIGRLGVRHVRDGLAAGRPDQQAAWVLLAAAGARVTAIVGDDPATAVPELEGFAAAHPGVVEAVEGPNEWDQHGGTWASDLRARQQALHDALEATPALASMPLLAPSLAYPSRAAALGDISGLCDLGNAHAYTGGQPPASGLDTKLAQLRANTGTHPVVLTETGYHNAMATTGGHLPAPEDVAGVYLPRMVLEAAARGIGRAFAYELIDEFPDPAGAAAEKHFGLVRNDLTPKPAFDALAALIARTSDPGPASTPAPLDYTATGPADLRQLLTQRRDGTWTVFLWRDVSIYDPSTRTRTTVAPAEVTLTHSTGHSSHQVAGDYVAVDVAAAVTRRTKTSVDARCSRCPGVMVLWADRDKHTVHLS